MFVLVAKEVVENSLKEPPEKVRELLKEFLDVCPSKLLDVLPFIHDIQHTIEFIHITALLNLPHYMMNLVIMPNCKSKYVNYYKGDLFERV